MISIVGMLDNITRVVHLEMYNINSSKSQGAPKVVKQQLGDNFNLLEKTHFQKTRNTSRRSSMGILSRQSTGYWRLQKSTSWKSLKKIRYIPRKSWRDERVVCKIAQKIKKHAFLKHGIILS